MQRSLVGSEDVYKRQISQSTATETGRLRRTSAEIRTWSETGTWRSWSPSGSWRPWSSPRTPGLRIGKTHTCIISKQLPPHILRDGSYFLYATFLLSFTSYLYAIYFKHSQGEGTIFFHLHPGISASPRFSLPPIHTVRKTR